MENRESTNTASFGLAPPGPVRPNFFLMGQPIYVAAAGVQLSQNAAPAFNFTIPVENSSSALNKKRGRPNPEDSLTTNLAQRPNADEGPITRFHVLTVNAGEDVVREIMKFAQQGSQDIFILSATGPISSVTLHQPMSSGDTITYKGELEIHYLTGYIPSESGVTLGRNDGMRGFLVRPGGTLFGGRLAGSLMAAGPVTVELLSSSVQKPQQQIKKQRREGLGIPATAQVANTSSGGSEEDPNARYRVNNPVVLQPKPVSAPPVLIQPVSVSEPPVSAPTDLIQPVPVSEPPVSFSHGPSTDTVHAYYPNDKKV